MWTWSGERAGWMQASSRQGRRPGTGRLACVEAGRAASSRVIRPGTGRLAVQRLDPRRLSSSLEETVGGVWGRADGRSVVGAEVLRVQALGCGHDGADMWTRRAVSEDLGARRGAWIQLAEDRYAALAWAFRTFPELISLASFTILLLSPCSPLSTSSLMALGSS